MQQQQPAGQHHHEKAHSISIWFFIGVLLVIYGVLILGAQWWTIDHPPEHPVVLANLHAGYWWGALLTALGLVYSIRFRPGKS
jgi:hypothetical protein